MSRVSCFFLTHGVVGWPIADSSLTKWPPVDHRWVKSGESPLARDQCPYHWATPLYALVAWLIVRTTEVKLKQNSFKTVTKLFWNRFETVYISVSFNLCGQFYKRSNNYISTTFSHQKLVVVEYKRIYTRKKKQNLEAIIPTIASQLLKLLEPALNCCSHALVFLCLIE